MSEVATNHEEDAPYYFADRLLVRHRARDHRQNGNFLINDANNLHNKDPKRAARYRVEAEREFEAANELYELANRGLEVNAI